MSRFAVLPQIESIDQLQDRLQQNDYIADRSLTTSIFLALKLRKPLFLEGEAGVGKTEVAKVLAAMLGRPLIRLQCYEGLDVHSAVYEWNFSRQILQIRLLEASGPIEAARAVHDIFGPEFLLKRPLLQAIDGSTDEVPVLLIDELDRADEEFEAYLLEILSEFQISIPEIGTIKAAHPPIVVLTSNRTREIHDALKRRCLYAWIDYPDFDKEYEIITAKIPDASAKLARRMVAFVQELRKEDLYKRPGVAESLDWMMALAALHQETLTEGLINETLGVLLKYQDDIEHVRGERVRQIFGRVR